MADDLFSSVYNPDVLSCLANLSNDEVFTPPDVVNKMLDMLPQELFRNPDTTFLDPACKTGVFLREIAKRLITGLESQMPDLQERIDHIFHKQIYAIAITELTSLLSRRGVYCSKYPNSEFSVTQFDDAEGNIRYRNIKHSWVNGKCKFCGTSKSTVLGGGERGQTLESHAYEWIHTLKPEEIFNMKFDVIISNPPYQLDDGGAGKSAKPIYQLFVNTAKQLKPRFISMIIPSRWFSGGKDVTEFRQDMLHDNRIRVLHDYLNAADCFSGVDIKGGVCYFLWERDNEGLCEITTHKSDNSVVKSTRKLLEPGVETFIRESEMITILHKVQKRKEKSIVEIISARDPFGYDIREENSLKTVPHKYSLKKSSNENVEFYYNGWRRQGVGYVSSASVGANTDWVKKYKVLIPRSWGSGDATKDRLKPFIAGPQAVCTETYVVVGPFDTCEEAENAITYINTKFFHALVALMKISQQAPQKIYSFVPIQDFNKPWSDTELYAKYDLNSDEIEVIESLIKPLDGGDADAD